jgi:hypothetical protein
MCEVINFIDVKEQILGEQIEKFALQMQRGDYSNLSHWLNLSGELCRLRAFYLRNSKPIFRVIDNKNIFTK